MGIGFLQCLPKLFSVLVSVSYNAEVYKLSVDFYNNTKCDINVYIRTTYYVLHAKLYTSIHYLY